MKRVVQPRRNSANVLERFLNTYELFRKYGEHENLLINHRITWMLTIHGFLYATYGFTIQKLAEISEKAASFEAGHKNRPGNASLDCYIYILDTNFKQIISFLWCIIGVGFVISLSALISIRAAYIASQTLNNIFYRNYPKAPLHYKSSPPEKDTIPTIARYGNRLLRKKLPVMHILQVGKLKFPIPSGGGRIQNEFTGSLASSLIPIILLISWAVSAYYLENLNNRYDQIFDVGDQCPRHNEHKDTIR